MRQRFFLSIALSGLVAVSAAACGSSAGAGGGSKVVTVAYEDYGTFHAMGQLIRKITPTFEKEHPGWTVKAEPINAPENDYYTKLDLMNRSPSTQPDVMYEDTFLINSDTKAGYLAPVNSYVNSWADWRSFYPAAKTATQATDGKIYGVPMETDTRGLWYNKQLFARAGLPVPWQPKTWADVLAAARTIKAKLPGVIPLNVYSGTPSGEATTMQGFEMLLYGTGETLYNHATNKWIAPGAGFTSAMNFIKTVYTTGLGPTPQQELNPNVGTEVFLAATTLPFAIWLMKNFMDGVPIGLEEAAWTDGASSMQALRRIVVPLILPGASVVGIFTFIGTWGNFFIPFILLTSQNKMPASVTIYQFFSQYGQVAYGPLAAYSILFTAPVVVLYVLVQRTLGGAFNLAGATKG